MKNPEDAALLPPLWLLKEVTTQKGSLALTVPTAKGSRHYPQWLSSWFGSAFANAMTYLRLKPKQPFLDGCVLAPPPATRVLAASQARGDVVNLSQQ